MSVTACILCGGNVGGFSPDGAHYRCEALAARGLPTPSLGERCPTCNGAGTLGKGGVMMFLSWGPALIDKSIAAQFPPCPDCNGARVIPGSDPGRHEVRT